MQKYTGDEIKDLLFIGMTDDRMIEMIDCLGLEQPMMDEQYQEEQEILILDKKNTGLSFGFEEIKNYTKNGEPCLVDIGFYNDKLISFPYDIVASDNYQNVKEKIGRKANFKDDEIFPEMRIWIMENPKGLKYCVNVFFKDEENLNGIETVVVQQYKPNLHNTDNYTVCEE